MRKDSFLGYAALALLLAEGLAILVSWLITAAMPESPMRSMLSHEGIRWLFGHFVDNVAQPLLVWLLLAATAWGAAIESGLVGLWGSRGRLAYRQRVAVRMVAVVAVAIIVVMLLLTAVPHAVLLSVTGGLWPSSFSVAVVPVICLSVSLLSVVYGVMSGTLRSVGSVFHALTVGIASWRGVWLLYVLSAELWFSLKFIWML